MRLKRFELYIFLGVSFLILSASFAPFVYSLFKTPEGQVFTGAHNYPPDYFSYLAQIRTGVDGHLFYEDKFTSEVVQPSLIKVHYTGLGLLGRVVGADPVFLYHGARLVLGALYLLVVYVFMGFFLKKWEWRLAGFLMAVFTASVPRFVGGEVGVYLSDYTFVDPLFRATFLPHHLLRNIYFYVFLFLVFRIVREKMVVRWLYFPVLGLGALHLGVLSPHHALVFILVISVFLVKHFWERREVEMRDVGVVSVFLGGMVLGVYLLNLHISTGFYGIVKEWEVATFTTFPFWEVILAWGPALFFSLLCVFNRKICRAEFFALGFLVLITLGFTCLPVQRIVPISPMRFLQIPVFPALAILAVLGIERMGMFLGRWGVKEKLVLWVFVIVGIGVSLPAFFNSFRQQVGYPLRFPTNLYIKGGEREALSFLEKEGKDDEIVFCTRFNGNLIPGFTGKRVFVGHLLATYRYAEKAKLTEAFFAGRLEEEEAEKIFIDHDVRYVWLGELERGCGGNIVEAYPALGLNLVFENPNVSIYKVGLEEAMGN